MGGGGGGGNGPLVVRTLATQTDSLGLILVTACISLSSIFPHNIIIFKTVGTHCRLSSLEAIVFEVNELVSGYPGQQYPQERLFIFKCKVTEPRY